MGLAIFEVIILLFMNKSVFSKPLVRAGWLRALLYLIAFVIITGTVLSIYILGLHKGKPDGSDIRDLMKGDKLWASTLFLFVLTFLLSYVFRRWVDRKPFVSLGLNLEGHGREAMAGGMLAIFIVGASGLLLKWTGHLKWMDIIFDPNALFLAFGTIVLIAFYEELIFRGYILNNLMDSLPKWLALLISALLFMIFHWTSLGFFPLLTTLIMGLILGMNYLYTRNLWFSICFHVAWKFLEGPVLGFSGDGSFQTLLQIDLHGDENITGATNGLEGSVFLMAVSLLSFVAVHLFLQKKLNPQSQPVPGRI
jgi:membrane protease YdiL (CAAX protease family)